MEDKLSKTFVIRISLFIGLMFVLIIWLSGSDFLSFNQGDKIELSFEEFAVAINFGFEALPNVAKQFLSVGAIATQLLMQGFSPIIFGIILSAGQLVGQMGLYVVGMFIRKSHSGSFAKIASKNHFFHQHHFLIYLAIPFTGILGDGLMLYSGHQRINPVKIIPFVFMANLLDNYKWVYSTVAQLNISDGFS